MTYLPRFHPMIATMKGQTGWWIMDCCAKDDIHARDRAPYADEPCETRDEAKEICDMLNETEPDPREERDARSSSS